MNGVVISHKAKMIFVKQYFTLWSCLAEVIAVIRFLVTAYCNEYTFRCVLKIFALEILLKDKSAYQTMAIVPVRRVMQKKISWSFLIVI